MSSVMNIFLISFKNRFAAFLLHEKYALYFRVSCSQLVCTSIFCPEDVSSVFYRIILETKQCYTVLTVSLSSAAHCGKILRNTPVVEEERLYTTIEALFSQLPLVHPSRVSIYVCLCSSTAKRRDVVVLAQHN